MCHALFVLFVRVHVFCIHIRTHTRCPSQVSKCEKFRIYVSSVGAFVVAQTLTGVLPGDRVGDFGSGGFRTAAEIAGLVTGGSREVYPVLANDMDTVVLLADEGKSPQYLAFHTMVMKLLEEGTVSWPIQLLFHTVTRNNKGTRTGKRERTSFQLTYTREKSWVTLPKKKKPDDAADKPTWANIFRTISDPRQLNNTVVKVVWQIKPASQLGLLRLERPCVVWNCTMELTPGAVVRIA